MQMQAEHVAELYRALDQIGVTIWIDGGWAVDAVLGRQTRSHDDLDLVIEAKSLLELRQFLAQRSYCEVPYEGATAWNFVVADKSGRKVDVHVVVLDEHEGVWGNPLDGIAYPAGSLTGEGVIAGARVRCVRAEVLLQFKTSYPPREIDRKDVAALCALLGRQTPDGHT
jgi:lincosamide nucleotidyltransferase A/C/D/E